MRKFSLALSTIALALVCLTASSPAAPTTFPNGTLTVSVTTDGYTFTPAVGFLTGPGGKTKPLPPQVIAASVALSNYTTAGIPCTLAATGNPGQKFEFIVYDSNGNEVWNSLPNISMPLEVLETLKAGDTWHGNASVPLFVNHQVLPAGTYTLEAVLYGSPVFSATTSFVVTHMVVVD